MPERGPDFSPEAAKYEARKQVVLDNVRALDAFEKDQLQDLAHDTYEINGKEYFGVNARARFDTGTGRIARLGMPGFDRPSAGQADALFFVGSAYDVGGAMSETEIPEWTIEARLQQRYPEAVAALETSFKAFGLANKQRAEQRRR